MSARPHLVDVTCYCTDTVHPLGAPGCTARVPTRRIVPFRDAPIIATGQHAALVAEAHAVVRARMRCDQTFRASGKPDRICGRPAPAHIYPHPMCGRCWRS